MRCAVEFGQNSAEIGHNLVDPTENSAELRRNPSTGRNRAACRHVCAVVGQMWRAIDRLRTLTGIGRICPEFGQIPIDGSESTEFGPMSADIGQSPADLDHLRPRVGRMRPDADQIWAARGGGTVPNRECVLNNIMSSLRRQICAMPLQVCRNCPWPRTSQARSKPATAGPYRADFGQFQAKARRTRANDFANLCSNLLSNRGWFSTVHRRPVRLPD